MINVLYGDNGAGKTTILNLIFACLSPQTNIGLRTLIAKTPFKEFTMSFSDASEISVKKIHGLYGSYVFKIGVDNESSEIKIFADEENSVPAQTGIEKLERSLRHFGIDVLFVDHERYIKSTYQFLQEISREGATQHSVAAWVPQFTIQNNRSRRPDSLQFPLTGMIEALDQKLRGEAYHQGNTSEEGASNVYLEIAKALVRSKPITRSSAETERDSLAQILDRLEKETSSYIRHGLLPNYPFQDLRNIYLNASFPKKKSIDDALSPFVASVDRRIDSLKSIHDLITSLEHELNKYLSNKIAEFHVLRGLSLFDDRGMIEFESLSSGEKQLLFLLSAAIVSRNTRSLILIDEPELSLNYRWQRLFTNSLYQLSSPQNTQFLMATHSIEIISRQGDNSVELVNDKTKTSN